MDFYEFFFMRINTSFYKNLTRNFRLSTFYLASSNFTNEIVLNIISKMLKFLFAKYIQKRDKILFKFCNL